MVSVGSGSPDEDPPVDSPLYPELEGYLPAPGPVGYTAGRGQVPPARSHEAFKPYVAPRVTRRRRSDWPVLVFALIVATLVMAACCIAGFAVYVKHGGTFG